jgi:hypothetical protein
VGHTKVRCTKPPVEDEDNGIGDTHGDGFAAAGGSANDHDRPDGFSTGNLGAESAEAPVTTGDWGATAGGGSSW